MSVSRGEAGTCSHPYQQTPRRSMHQSTFDYYASTVLLTIVCMLQGLWQDKALDFGGEGMFSNYFLLPWSQVSSGCCVIFRVLSPQHSVRQSTLGQSICSSRIRKPEVKTKLAQIGDKASMPSY